MIKDNRIGEEDLHSKVADLDLVDHPDLQVVAPALDKDRLTVEGLIPVQVHRLQAPHLEEDQDMVMVTPTSRYRNTFLIKSFWY
jgi:hypothetical protein